MLNAVASPLVMPRTASLKKLSTQAAAVPLDTTGASGAGASGSLERRPILDDIPEANRRGLVGSDTCPAARVAYGVAAGLPGPGGL